MNVKSCFGKEGVLELKCHCVSFLVLFLLRSHLYAFWSHRYLPNKWWCLLPLSHPAHSSSNSQTAAVLFRALLSLRMDLSRYRWPPQSYQTRSTIFPFPKIITFLLPNTTNLRLFIFLPHLAFCMLISLGPVIQVLSCLLHSTQGIFTSSLRPLASLFCRYSYRRRSKFVKISTRPQGIFFAPPNIVLVFI